jgi:hypothetical protein
MNAQPTRVRVLATPENVETLFKPTKIIYDYRGNDNQMHECEMPGWECRSCGWTSLYGAKNLPFPHEHEIPADHYGVAGEFVHF